MQMRQQRYFILLKKFYIFPKYTKNTVWNSLNLLGFSPFFKIWSVKWGAEPWSQEVKRKKCTFMYIYIVYGVCSFSKDAALEVSVHTAIQLISCVRMF